MSGFVTKHRLAQITGTFGTDQSIGQVSDQLSLLATGSVTADNLSTVLSHMASAIKRIHGASSFSEQVSGTFSQDIFFPDSVKAKFGTGEDFHVYHDGTTNYLSSSNANLYIYGDTIGLFGTTINTSGGATIKPTGGNLSVAGGMGGGSLTLAANGGLSGPTIYIPGAGTSLEISASILPDGDTRNLGRSANPWSTLYATNLGETGVPLYVLGDMMVSGTYTQAGVVNFADDVYVATDLYVSGNFYVSGVISGTVTTINTVNLTVQDPIILLANNSVASNTNGGLAVLSGSSVADQSLVFGRVADDTWGVGRLDVQNGNITSLAGMTLTNIQANQFQIDGSTSYLGGVGSNIYLVSADDIVITPLGGDVLVDGTLSPSASGGSSLGKSTMSWLNLFLTASSVINWDASGVTLTHGTGIGGNSLTLSGAIMTINDGVKMEDLGTDPSTPASGLGMFYVKTDKPYFINDLGVTYDLSASGSGGGVTAKKTQITVTGTINAHDVITVGTNTHDSLAPEYVDYYVNGSLMMSGTVTTGTIDAGYDYSIDGLTGSNARFAFQLIASDIVIMKKLSVS